MLDSMPNQEVIIAYEDSDTYVYGSARRLLRARLDDGFWYEDEDYAKARAASDTDTEAAALRFLQSRNDYEYERISVVTVQ